MHLTNLPWPGSVTRNKNCNPRKTEQTRVLDLAYEGHQGIVKMRALKVQSMVAWDRLTCREAMYRLF